MKPMHLQVRCFGECPSYWLSSRRICRWGVYRRDSKQSSIVSSLVLVCDGMCWYWLPVGCLYELCIWVLGVNHQTPRVQGSSWAKLLRTLKASCAATKSKSELRKATRESLFSKVWSSKPWFEDVSSMLEFRLQSGKFHILCSMHCHGFTSGKPRPRFHFCEAAPGRTVRMSRENCYVGSTGWSPLMFTQMRPCADLCVDVSF